MDSTKKYRDNGATGALLDEYERAIEELKMVIKNISQQKLTTIVDPHTKDEDCRSIQTILSHVVGAGFNYIIYIRGWLGEEIAPKNKELLPSSEAYSVALDNMFAYNEELFQEYPDLSLEEYKEEKKIQTRWGQRYDVEQLLEHAIVHVLRHRRQIERFKIKLQASKC